MRARVECRPILEIGGAAFPMGDQQQRIWRERKLLRGVQKRVGEGTAAMSCHSGQKVLEGQFGMVLVILVIPARRAPYDALPFQPSEGEVIHGMRVIVGKAP